MLKIYNCTVLINNSSQKLKVRSVASSLAIFCTLELSSFLRMRSQRSEDIRNTKYDNAKYRDTIRRRITTTLRVLCRLLN